MELHELFDGRLKIFQQKQGYRFSIDAILLGNFASRRISGKIADLGTGSGVLPVLLDRSDKIKEIIGIEIQTSLVELARKNVSLNQCGKKVQILHEDVRNLRNKFVSETFDGVISNPPFYTARSGRINPQAQKAIARHELYGTLVDFIAISAYLLKPHGKFILIFSCLRVVDLVEWLRKEKIEPKTLQFIHSKKNEPAAMVLVEAIKGGRTETKILPPLVLYDSGGRYTAQTKKIFQQL